jgi:hypothetical protein
MGGILQVDTIQNNNTSNLITQTNVTTITIGTSGQNISIPSGATLTGPGAGLIWQSVQTTSFTAVKGEAYPVDTTSAAITVTLPATPTAGDQVQLVDYAGTFDSNALTIDPNGEDIEGGTDNLALTGEREGVILTYIDSTQGWIATSGINEGTDALLPIPYLVDYLIIAGGGGGGTNRAGAGGAGGYLTGNILLYFGTTYTATVGGGGAGSNNNANKGTNGVNSTFANITSAIGGGGGGSASNLNGATGGSGGGGMANSGTGGSGTVGQGNAGASGSGTIGGGGGGAGAAATTRNGASGLASSITGSSITRAGGGGGGTSTSPAGTGGSGGGGAGSFGDSNQAATAGTANTGGGGGGATGGGSALGGAGGSGVIILSIPTANYTGTTTGSPTVTTSGANTILQFNGSGSYTG